MKNVIDRNLKLSQGKVVFLLFFTLFLILPPSVAFAAWNWWEFPDWVYDANDTSIAVDSNNKVHISYCSIGYGEKSYVTYATNASGAWITGFQLDDITSPNPYEPECFTSIAVDSNNKVYISYQDYDEMSLKLATITGTLPWPSYTKETIDSCWCEHPVGRYNSIAMDSNNKVHISYVYEDLVNTSHEYWLRHATNATGAWVYENLIGFSIGLGQTSIAIDSNNKVHISYFLRDISAGPFEYLIYITNAYGDYIQQFPPVNACMSYEFVTPHDNSIAIDSNNKAHISYSCRTDYFAYAFYDYIFYTTNASGAWVFPTIVGGPWAYSITEKRFGTSIAADSNNKVHISYFDKVNNMLKYVNSNTWLPETVDSSSNGNGNYNSIAIDSNNNVHISYLGGLNSSYRLKYATNAPPVTCADNDHDGYGNPGNASCPNGSATDCNDNDQSVNPGATEGPYGHATCTDGKDNDCDGAIDAADTNCQSTNADLIVSSWTAPANACAGATISIKDTTKNQGPGTAGASQTCFYFSTNTTLDAGDTKLGCRAIKSLASGEPSPLTGKATTNVTLPSVSTGKYYIIAMADDGKVVTESNETNNKKSKVIYIGPDLIVSALTAAPTSAARGTTIDITDTTKNKGCGTAGASTTKFYLSTNTTLDTGDIPLGSRSVPSLGTGAPSTWTTKVTIPSGIATGTYYIIANADDGKVVVEASETNNKKTKQITIN